MPPTFLSKEKCREILLFEQLSLVLDSWHYIDQLFVGYRACFLFKALSHRLNSCFFHKMQARLARNCISQFEGPGVFCQVPLQANWIIQDRDSAVGAFGKAFHCPGHKYVKNAWVWEWQSHGESGYQKYLLPISTAVNRILRDRKHHDCRWYKFLGTLTAAADWRQLCVTDGSWAVQSQDATRQNLKRFEGAFNATQHGSTQVSRGARRHRESAVGACFCVKNWGEMHWHCFDLGTKFDLNRFWLLNINENELKSSMFRHFRPRANAAFILMLNTAVLC